jgi:UDP-4-amino-4,6-dideoxy-N-acetyl-beta-L-altrosamine N-acetyltransferase
MVIYLREITRQDMTTINAWRNDPKVTDCLGSPFRYINLETDEAWFDSYMRNRNTQVRCAICLAGTKEMIGTVYLLNMDSVSRSAELGIIIGEKEEQNQGLGTAAIKLILNHAFLNLNVHRVYLSVLEDNKRAIRVYEKIGFQKEGILRQAIFKKGNYSDLWIMSILENEYRL